MNKMDRNDVYKLDPVILTKGLLIFNDYIRKEFGNGNDEYKRINDEQSIRTKQSNEPI